MVLTHTGNYKPVINTMNRESNDLYELEINDEIFYVTGNHLVMTNDGWITVENLQEHHDIQFIKTI